MTDLKEIRFEIHVCTEGRWTIFTDAQTKSGAIGEAKSILGGGKFEAVRVIEDRGQISDTVVFEEAVKGKVVREVTITPVTEAPVCTKVDDLFTARARLTLGRVLRKYFDHVNLTPTEVLHNAGNLKALLREENLVLQATQNIAGVQAKSTGQKAFERYEILEKLTRQVRDRADALEGIAEDLTVLRSKGAGRLIEMVSASHAPENQFYYIRAVIAAHLSEVVDWDGKLGLLIDLCDSEPDSQTLSFVDEIMAEIFDGASAVQELLGYQRTLATAIRTLIQLSVGAYPVGKPPYPVLERVSQIMARYHMPETRQVMVERVARALNGLNPLTKGDKEEERAAFIELMKNLVGNKVLGDNGLLAEALTLRAKTLFTKDGEDESSEKAVADVIAMLPTKALKFGYLLDLCGTPFGAETESYIVQGMAEIVDSMTSAEDLVEVGAEQIKIIEAAAGIRDRLLSTALPDQWRRRFARRIYELLVQYDEVRVGQPRTAENNKPSPAPKASPKQCEVTEEAKAADADDASSAPKFADGPLEQLSLSAGNYLFREGDVGDAAYLIVSGQIEILRDSGEKFVSIAKAGPGSIIGEMAMLDAEPRMASARAMEDTKLTVIPMTEMKLRIDRLEKYDPVLYRMVGTFVQRMRDYKIIDAD